MEKVVLPKLSKDMKEGVIVNWCKKPGDTFEKGDLLFEVETSKVICEVEAKGNGKVRDILVEEGSSITVGDTVMLVDRKEEQ